MEAELEPTELARMNSIEEQEASEKMIREMQA